MQSVWNRDLVQITKDMSKQDYSIYTEEDFGSSTFLWNAYVNNEHVDIELGIKASQKSESVSFSAHKLILAMRSPYFADRFYGCGNATENIIFFEGVNPKAFKTMLEYMYGCCTFPKSVKEARDLYKVAVKFEVATLAERAENIINRTPPDISNLFDFIEVAGCVKNLNVIGRCKKLISEQTSEILQAYSFTDITPSRLDFILESPKLALNSEYELLQWVYAWGKNRYITVPEYSGVREALEEFLPKLNFLALSNHQFAEFHKNHPDFLKEGEALSIFMNIALAGSWPMPDWHKDRERVYTGYD